jgi:Putative prokaryotic signal transducing protein
MATRPDDDIVKLATASNPAQAHLWQQILQEEGIRCQAVGDYLDAGFGDIPGLRAEIWVHRNDVPRALEVLRTAQKPATADEAGDEEDPDDMSESV